MLKLRIRELERQVGDMNPNNQANTPPVPSNLATSPPVETASALTPRALLAGDMDKD